MPFWRGVKKIAGGLADIAATPSEQWNASAENRRIQMTGEYEITGQLDSTVRIQFTYDGYYQAARINWIKNADGMHRISQLSEDQQQELLWEYYTDVQSFLRHKMKNRLATGDHGQSVFMASDVEQVYKDFGQDKQNTP